MAEKTTTMAVSGMVAKGLPICRSTIEEQPVIYIKS